MTNANGLRPETEDHTPQEGTQEPAEPRLEAYSLDYWREMTERQVDRLRARIRQLEDEAAPLRMQISALTNALRAVDHQAKPRPPVVRRGRSGAVSTRVSSAEREAITRMVQEGKTNAEIRAALPHVPKSNIFNFAYNDRLKSGLLRARRS